jgi:hypothetical protein
MRYVLLIPTLVSICTTTSSPPIPAFPQPPPLLFARLIRQSTGLVRGWNSPEHHHTRIKPIINTSTMINQGGGKKNHPTIVHMLIRLPPSSYEQLFYVL